MAASNNAEPAEGAFDTLCALLRGESRGTLRWDALLPLAELHGVAPLLCERLGHGAYGPLHELCRGNFARNILLTEQLLKLLSALQSAGVEALPYRGPILAALAYGKIGCRVFGDLDFLVRSEDISAAKNVLAKLGYESLHRFSVHLEAQRLRTSGELGLRHAHLPFVELHTTLVAPVFPFPLDYDGVWRRTQRIELNGCAVATLGNEDTLLMLCVHAAQPKACWNRLSMVCDVAALVQAKPNINWAFLQKQADQTHTRRALLLGLWLASELLGAQVPEDVRAAIHADRVLPALGRLVRRHLATGGGLSRAEKMRFSLLVRERFRDAMRLCVAKLFTPTEPDWRAFQAPPSRLWLYTFYRPFRLLKETLGSVRKTVLRTSGKRSIVGRTGDKT